MNDGDDYVGQLYGGYLAAKRCHLESAFLPDFVWILLINERKFFKNFFPNLNQSYSCIVTNLAAGGEVEGAV